ncbi:MAG: ROK family protein [Bryobacteraceae bacterium]
MNGTVLCVDIGGTSTKAGLLDGAGRISFIDFIPTGPDQDRFAASLYGLIERTTQAANADSKPSRIGVAVAGFLDDDRNCLIYNPNLAWLEGFPLRNRLAQRFDLPIELEIDSNAACMAEYRFGFNQEPARFLCVTAGTGLGVGMTIDGQPLRFAYGCMGDVGHLIVDRYGPACSCGGRGCAEALISAPALADRYRMATGDNGCLSLRNVITAAETGSSAAVEILRDAGTALGVALASLANTFFPDHIAVAGGLSVAGDFVMEAVQQTFQELASKFARSRVKIWRAVLGPNATLIGAAWPYWKESPHGESKS